MSLPPIGDMSRSYATGLGLARLDRELTRLGQEVTTGLSADPGRAMGGDTAPLAAVERGLSRVSAHETSLSEMRVLTEATQIALERAGSRLAMVADATTGIGASNTKLSVDVLAHTAREAFEGMVSDLNTEVGGVRLFAGVATDGPATRPAGEILAGVREAVGGATTAAELDAAVTAYFAEGGGFDEDYLGAEASRAPVRVAAGESVGFAPRADSGEVRAGLAALARLAVLDAGALPGDAGERRAVVQATATGTFAARDGLTGLQAAGGVVEERLERAEVRTAAERDGLERARLDMIGVDPYEAAVRLEQSRTQMESLYAVTARLSGLTLTAYLR